MMDTFTERWMQEILQPVSSRGVGGNKLRLYCTFKNSFKC